VPLDELVFASIQVQMVEELYARRFAGQSGELEKELWRTSAEIASDQDKAWEISRPCRFGRGISTVEGGDLLGDTRPLSDEEGGVRKQVGKEAEESLRVANTFLDLPRRQRQLAHRRFGAAA
jgi:hypothetical protein